MENVKKVIPEEIKRKIIENKVNEIDDEEDINQCRNKFSVIIKFKQREYEKDSDVSDLFFRLLNDTIEKKKLALDNFEYYYEDKVPHRRKVELTERLNNLLDEFDRDYKERIFQIGKKYNLKLKRSFWGLFNNFID